MMKITVFNGSPRAEHGNTQVMVGEFLKGAEQAGAQSETIFLARQKIQHCLGCFTCWTKTPGKCAINDDMTGLLEKLINSDLVVFAAPIYVGSVPGLMKDFIDRLIPLAEPKMIDGPEGFTCHPSRYGKKTRVVLISNCGFPEQTHFKYFRTVFEYIALNSVFEIIGEIYRGEGALLTNTNIMLQMILGGYKKLLQKAGREIVENGKLDETTKAELEKPLIPYRDYRNNANKHWEQCLSSKQ